MLTWGQIEALCAAGKLVRWKPHRSNGSAPTGRALYMVPEVKDAIDSSVWPTALNEKPERARLRRSVMRMVLERFHGGDELTLDVDLKELGSGRRNPAMRGFWEFRSGPPRVQARVLGFFARPSAFVSTSFRMRDYFEVDSSRWLSERIAADECWEELFPDHKPMIAPWPVRSEADLRGYIERA